MAKLPSKIAKRVDKSEQVSTDFENLKPGKYAAKLYEVGVEEHPNFPDHVSVWVVQFNEIRGLDGSKFPGRQFLRLNVILDDKMPANYAKTEDKWEAFVRISTGQLKAFFENIGYTTDSDTDDMIGEPALLNVGIRTIQTGNRAGEKVNDVRGVIPVPDNMEDAFSEVYDDDEDEDDDTF